MEMSMRKIRVLFQHLDIFSIALAAVTLLQRSSWTGHRGS